MKPVFALSTMRVGDAVWTIDGKKRLVRDVGRFMFSVLIDSELTHIDDRGTLMTLHGYGGRQLVYPYPVKVVRVKKGGKKK